jgi:hypothetical protein
MLDVADGTHGSGLPRGSKAMVSGIGAPTLCVALLALPATHAADFKVLSPEPENTNNLTISLKGVCR